MVTTNQFECFEPAATQFPELYEHCSGSTLNDSVSEISTLIIPGRVIMLRAVLGFVS
jgi:hypothetical protein